MLRTPSQQNTSHGIEMQVGAKHAFHEVEWKLIMTGGNGGMGSKHALLTDDLDVVREGRPTRVGPAHRAVPRRAGWHAPIHMPAGEGRIAERPHAHPRFPAAPLPGTAGSGHHRRTAYWSTCGPRPRCPADQRPKIHRHGEVPETAHHILPGAEGHGPPRQ